MDGRGLGSLDATPALASSCLMISLSSSSLYTIVWWLDELSETSPSHEHPGADVGDLSRGPKDNALPSSLVFDLKLVSCLEEPDEFLPSKANFHHEV